MVLVDSMSPWERPVSSAMSMRRGGCGSGVAVPRTREFATGRPACPPVECDLAGFAFDRERVTQSFFEEVGAPQSRVGLGDPVELGALTTGEITGVLP